jgi:hypothetical protein
LGDDGGCFAAALRAVNKWGGVIEHPADSLAWAAHDIQTPPRSGGWICAEDISRTTLTAWTCCVYQGHYGHESGKATWLYVAGVRCEDLPALKWGKTEQRIPQWMIDRFGYEKARRYGVVSMIGAMNKTAIRNATPEPFRDLLISIARKASI